MKTSKSFDWFKTFDSEINITQYISSRKYSLYTFHTVSIIWPFKTTLQYLEKLLKSKKKNKKHSA